MTSIELPFIVTVEDYHDKTMLQDIFKQVLSEPVKVYEVGFTNDYDRPYVMLVHTGNLPGDDVVNTLLTRKGIVLVKED